MPGTFWQLFEKGEKNEYGNTIRPHCQSGIPYRLIDTLNLSYRQVYAGDCNCPERRISAGAREYQKDTQYYYQLKPAEPGVLFPAFCGGAEGISRNESRAGFTPLNDLCLCGRKLNREKNIIK